MDDSRINFTQLVGSLLVAAAIFAVAIVAVTAQLGPTSAAELDAREEARDARIDAREELRDERQDRREERAEP